MQRISWFPEQCWLDFCLFSCEGFIYLFFCRFKEWNIILKIALFSAKVILSQKAWGWTSTLNKPSLCSSILKMEKTDSGWLWRSSVLWCLYFFMTHSASDAPRSLATWFSQLWYVFTPQWITSCVKRLEFSMSVHCCHIFLSAWKH